MTSYDINSALGRKRGRYNQGLPTRSAGVRHHDDVCIAHWIVQRSGILELVETYRDEDSPHRHTNGGRPERVTDEQLLVAGVLAGMSTTGMHDKEMATILWEQLGPQSRELLRVPAEHEGTFDNYYLAFNRKWHRLCRLIDPKPNMGFRRHTRAEVEAFKAALDPEICARKKERLHTVSNALLEATWQLLPRRVRDQWDGSVAIDGTPIRIWGKRGVRKSATGDRMLDLISPEIWHGVYHRDPDKRGTDAKGTFCGFEAHIVVNFDPAEQNPDNPTIPVLALAMTFDQPGTRIADNSYDALASVTARGHKVGLFAADRGVLPGGKDTNLHGRARALGYELCFDYRIDQLGQQGSYAGAKLVDGNWYSACLPPKLVDATITYRTAIDAATNSEERQQACDAYAKALKQRTLFLLRDKAKPDSDGYTPKMCAAAGTSPTAKCSLKPNPNLDRRITKALPFVVINKRDIPAHPDKICTNTSSVTFPPSAGGNFTQHLQYGTPEWKRIYAASRNASEGFNGYVKDHGHEALEVPGRRRVRGFARQCMLTAILLACANYRKIVALDTTVDTDAPTPQPATRARRRTESVRDPLPDANAPPGADEPAQPGEAA